MDILDIKAVKILAIFVRLGVGEGLTAIAPLV